MNSKKIATSIPRSQYVALERVRKKRKLKRSQAVQEALELWLTSEEKDARATEYVRAYLTHPEEVREAGAYARAWAHGQVSEDWS